jgi:hypothetical protein
MVTAEEKERLMKQYRNDLLASRAIILKCAAGLAVIALIGVIGTQTDTGRSTYAPEHVPQVRTFGTLAESQRQMEERRERYRLAARSSGLQAAPVRHDPGAAADTAAAIDDVTLLRRSSD